ncbi:unnamed protein product [Leuciscus chuanchicus]
MPSLSRRRRGAAELGPITTCYLGRVLLPVYQARHSNHRPLSLDRGEDLGTRGQTSDLLVVASFTVCRGLL